MSVLIQNIILDGEKQDIFIEGNKIKKINNRLNIKAKTKINGKGEKAAIPGLINCHTHAAMTLFRGYADDLPLKVWLEDKIWPLEAKLTEDDVYWGTKLACLEMIKTGTICFNDMYWYPEITIKAVEEMGIKGAIGLILIDFDQRGSKETVEKNYKKLIAQKSNLVKLTITPHAIYTVSKENLIWAKNFAKKNKLILHIHISETEQEVKDCQKKWKMRPVEYLEKIAFLGENVILSHGLWLSNKEINILSKRKCNLVYNPCSNLKLAVGKTFPYKELKENRVNVCLGTDGAASNNNLDLFEEMKMGALLQKQKEKDPTATKAKKVFAWATKNGARALKINSGEIKEGKLADLILVDLTKTFFSPGHNFFSDIVYAGSGLVVSDVVCNGRILMRDGRVAGEKEIIRKAKEVANKIITR